MVGACGEDWCKQRQGWPGPMTVCVGSRQLQNAACPASACEDGERQVGRDSPVRLVNDLADLEVGRQAA